MITKTPVTAGVYWVEIPDRDLYILCGAPMDSIKHLMRRGLVRPIERQGIVYETGPNAILLCDLPMQDGHFRNLSEFPILHMMFKQGMSLPDHPGNDGSRPLLMGTREQVEAQADYILRGTYGLASLDELRESGLDEATALALWNLKLRFNYDRIKDARELMDLITLDDGPVEIRDGVFVERKDLNRYEIRYGEETVSLDMDPAGEQSAVPYTLGDHSIEREYFSVVHIGEGNGWDMNRPCMGSLLTWRGRCYLIDAGPGLDYSLSSLGICVNEIDGIFHTHGHDDHFAGLTTLLRADRRIPYYATGEVYASVKKKFNALLGQESPYFDRVFDVRLLEADTWNDVAGLEVLPSRSPHPVETTTFFFRTMWEGGYRSYAHMADIVSRRVLEDFVRDGEGSGISRAFYDKVWEEYLRPAYLKKIDAGKGLIHGEAVDFQNDLSDKLILSHTDRELSVEEKEIGSNASFGMQEILIPTRENYLEREGEHYLKHYLGGVEEPDLQMLMNSEIHRLDPGHILIRRGTVPDHVYLVLTGFVEYIRSEDHIDTYISVGNLLGEYPALTGDPSKGTFRTGCYLSVMAIPSDLYRHVTSKIGLDRDILAIRDTRDFVLNSHLLGQMISWQRQDLISRELRRIRVRKGEKWQGDEGLHLRILVEGRAALYRDGIRIRELAAGEPFCLGTVIDPADDTPVFDTVMESAGTLYVLPAETIRDVPRLLWALLEEWYKRWRTV